MPRNPTITVNTHGEFNMFITDDEDKAATALCLRRLAWVANKVAGAYEGQYFNGEDFKSGEFSL